MNKNLIMRADASPSIGIGHAMRCLALAQAWNDTRGRGGIFMMAEVPPALEERLKSEGMEVDRLSAKPGSAEDARQTAALACKSNAQWVVVDGYHFGSEYQRILKEADLRLLFIDDNGLSGRYCADIVLNQNINARESLYSHREPYTRLLLGSPYVLIRREFWPWRGWQREIPEKAIKVLVTLGGGDPDNQTIKVIHTLEQVEIDGLEVTVVAGASNSHFRKLEDAVRRTPCSMRLVRNTSNMPELMAWADLAVSSGGTTCWESAFMGLPVVVGQIAPIEDLLVNGLKELDLFYHAGWFEKLSAEHLAQIIRECMQDKAWRVRTSRLGQQIVDGYGGVRVLETIPVTQGEKNERNN